MTTLTIHADDALATAIRVAAYLLVDKSKLPLALRGLKKVLGTAAPSASSAPPIPVWKRLLAFALILIAFVLAVV